MKNHSLNSNQAIQNRLLQRNYSKYIHQNCKEQQSSKLNQKNYFNFQQDEVNNIKQKVNQQDKISEINQNNQNLNEKITNKEPQEKERIILLDERTVNQENYEEKVGPSHYRGYYVHPKFKDQKFEYKSTDGYKAFVIKDLKEEADKLLKKNQTAQKFKNLEEKDQQETVEVVKKQSLKKIYNQKVKDQEEIVSKVQQLEKKLKQKTKDQKYAVREVKKQNLKKFSIKDTKDYQEIDEKAKKQSQKKITKKNGAKEENEKCEQIVFQKGKIDLENPIVDMSGKIIGKMEKVENQSAKSYYSQGLFFGNSLKGYEMKLNKVTPKYDKEGKLLNQEEIEEYENYLNELKIINMKAPKIKDKKLNLGVKEYLKKAKAEKNAPHQIDNFADELFEKDQDNAEIEQFKNQSEEVNEHFTNDAGDLPQEKVTLSEIEERLEAAEGSEELKEVDEFLLGNKDIEISGWMDDPFNSKNDWEIAQDYLTEKDYQKALEHLYNDMSNQKRILGKEIYTIALDYLQIYEIYDVMQQTQDIIEAQKSHFDQFYSIVKDNEDVLSYMRLDAIYYRLAQVQEKIFYDKDYAILLYEKALKVKKDTYQHQQREFGNQMLQNETIIYNINQRLGSILLERNQFEKAYDYYNQSLQHYRMYQSEKPKDRENLNLIIGRILIDLADAQYKQGEMAACLGNYNEGIETLKKFYKSQFHHKEITEGRLKLVLALEEFLENEQAIYQLDQIIKDYPQDQNFAKSDIAGRVLTQMGHLFQKSKYTDKAIECFQKVLDIDENTVGLNTVQAAVTKMNLATCFAFKGEDERAEKLFIRSKDILLQNDKNDENNIKIIAEIYLHLGNLKSKHKYLEESKIQSIRNHGQTALEYFKQSLQIKKKLLGESHLDVAQIYNNIGITYRDFLQNYQLAMENLEKAIQILDGIFKDSFNPLRNQVEHSYQHAKHLVEEEELKKQGLNKKSYIVRNLDMNPEDIDMQEHFDYL